MNARELRKKELGGVIFGCTHYTINECISKLIFGLPAIHFSYVKNIDPGLPLFLFNYSDRKLHGIYEAAGHGKMNIDPYGWTTNGSDDTHYPAQVRVRIRKRCQVLSEDKFKKILDKNYSEDQVSFQFELDKSQTSQLLSMFEPLHVSSSPDTISSNSRVSRPHYGPFADRGTRKQEGCMEKLDYVDVCSKKFIMGSKMTAVSPPPKLKWISLIKENSDSGSSREGDDEPLVLQPNLDEEVNASSINSDPEGITICLEDETSTRKKESVAPCLRDENKVAETQTEITKDDVEDIYTKLQKLALGKGNSNPNKHVEDISIPCEAENVHLADECSHVSPSETERKSSISEEDTKHVCVPCKSNNSDLEYECSPTKSLSSENSIISADVESVIDQLTKEMKEMQAFQTGQQQKSKLLEKELDDSEILLKHLRHRVMVLESCLKKSAKAAHNDSYYADPLLGVGEAVFIMGGYNGISWLSTVESYSPSRGISKSVNPMNSARSYSSAAVLNGLIYNFGGWNDHYKIWYDTAECYNPLTNEWISCPSLSERKGCLASASFNDKIYAVGGGNGADCFKEVEMFDPALGRWIRTQSMLQKRFASAAATLDGVLYVVGGYNGKHYLRSAERYDPREATWSKLQPMNTSRGSHALSVLDGKLYALGGYNGSKYVSSMEVFDPRNGSWVEDDEMRQSRGYFAAPVIGETIYAIGGQAETNNIVDLVETYRVGHGWSASKLEGIGKRCFFSAAVY
ncbi:hypothetical protein ACHQM5_006102 [Ranunculus cassubicifolius]